VIHATIQLGERRERCSGGVIEPARPPHPRFAQLTYSSTWVVVLPFAVKAMWENDESGVAMPMFLFRRNVHDISYADYLPVRFRGDDTLAGSDK